MNLSNKHTFRIFRNIECWELNLASVFMGEFASGMTAEDLILGIEIVFPQ